MLFRHERYITISIPGTEEFLSNKNHGWTSRDYQRKQELQRTIFPEGIYYSKKKGQTRTTKINSVFALIARQKGVLEEKETGISEVIFKNSGLGRIETKNSHQMSSTFNALVALRVENSNVLLQDLWELRP